MKYASLREGLQLAICPSVSGGGGIVPDLSGRGNHGVLTNMDASGYASWHRGNSLRTDGVNDYVSVAGAPVSFADRFSIAFWVNITSGRMLLTKGNMGTFGDRGYGFDFGGFVAGDIEFLAIESNLAYINRSAANPGGWVHVCGMFNSSIAGTDRLMLFLNGVQQTGIVTSVGTVSAVATNNANLLIGSFSSLSLFAAAQFDDVRAYSRVLTPSEIQLLASEPGIGLRPERTSVFFGAQLFQAAWLAQGRNIIGGGVC